MAQTIQIEMRLEEQWEDVADEFMLWCVVQKQMAIGGFHEGDAADSADGRRYAAIAIPDHSEKLFGYLGEWASSVGRRIG